MATAEELLAQMEENPELYSDSVGPVNDVIVINAEERTIELPESEKIFGVESDKASERKYFKCPKIVGDNIDLSALNLFINFKNANNEGDIYSIDDVAVEGDYITFSWKLSRKVTAYKTDASKNQLLSFIFCAKSGDGTENEWNTTICSDGIVLEGLEPGESIAEDNPDIIQYILERLDSAGVITPEQISVAVEEYFASNPIEETDPTVPSWAKEETPDKTLSEEGKAADAKATGDAISQLSDDIGDLSVLKETTTKTTLAEMLKEIYERLANGGTGDGSGDNPVVTPLEDNIGTDIPELVFTANNWNEMTKENDIDVAMSYTSDSLEWNGVANMKWQGSSSLAYDKKNFTVKLYTDSTKSDKQKINFNGWGLQNKFCLKANYIDHSHARNIVSARIWSEIVQSRSDYSSLPSELRNSPNNWEIDGFPVKVTVNGTYQGIYTLNIPKDAWMFNLDEYNVNHAVLCAEQNNNDQTTTATHKLACEFRANAEINGSDWSLEVPDVLQPTIKTSFNNLIDFVMTATDSQFRSGLNNYLDVQSAIDYYLYAYFGGFIDSLGKNVIMVTVDGTKWYTSMYDMDSTWGLFYTGTMFLSPTMACPENYQETNSLLWQRIETVFAKELKERYAELRQSILTVDNISSKFESFMNIIGSELYAQDLVPYPSIPLGDQDHLQQITEFVAERAVYVDAEIDALVETDFDKVSVTGVSLDSDEISLTLGSDGVEEIDLAQYGIYAGMEIYNSTEVSTTNTNSLLTGLIDISGLDMENNLYVATELSGADGKVGSYIDGAISKTYKLYDGTAKSFNDCIKENANYNGFKIMEISENGTFDNVKLFKISNDWIDANLIELEESRFDGITGTGDVYVPLDVQQGDIVVFKGVGSKWCGLSYDAVTAAINFNDNRISAIPVYNLGTVYVKVNRTNYDNGYKPLYAIVRPSELGESSKVLSATIAPTTATNLEVEWTVDNSNVTVESDGLSATVKAVSSGTSIVTVTSKDTTNGIISDTCAVTIS